MQQEAYALTLTLGNDEMHQILSEGLFQVINIAEMGEVDPSLLVPSVG